MSGSARGRGRMGFRFALLVCLVTAATSVLATFARAQNFPGPLNNLTAGGTLPLPPPPPQGAFYEVIFANAKWMVVQNQQGQQFPVAADYISPPLLIRWPASVGDLSPLVRVEAIGPEVVGMTIQTNHIDLFVGSDQSLVNPGYVSVLPINRPVTAIDPTYQRNMNGFDISAQNTLYSFVFPVNTGDNGIPGQMHVVGDAASLNPLRVAVPGNNFVTVLPPMPGVMTISQVTRGSVAFAAKGDFAFLTPVQGNPVTDKSLRLSQVVLYKKMRRDQYVP
jgi:hypothetical protein